MQRDEQRRPEDHAAIGRRGLGSYCLDGGDRVVPSSQGEQRARQLQTGEIAVDTAGEPFSGRHRLPTYRHRLFETT